MVYRISLNHSSSEHLGFAGYHLQGNTKTPKHMFDVKHACGSAAAFQIIHTLKQVTV